MLAVKVNNNRATNLIINLDKLPKEQDFQNFLSTKHFIFTNPG